MSAIVNEGAGMASDVTTSTPDDLVARVLDEGFLAGDPFPDLARLRAEAPVAHHAETGAWVLHPPRRRRRRLA